MNTKKRIQVLLNQLRREKKEEMYDQLKGEEKSCYFVCTIRHIYYLTSNLNI